MAVTQDEQMLINELRKYERALAKETRRADNLLSRSQKLGATPYLTARPKAYQFNFSFVPGDFTAITQTLSISEGKKFACHAISSSLSIVGQATVDTNPGGAPIYAAGQIANVTAGYSTSETGEGPSNRQRFFDFFWRLRDASGDNDFQDVEQPSVMMCSGHDSPLYFPVCWNISAGSLVEMEIIPFNSANPSTATNTDGLTNIRAYNMIVKLWGEEYL